MTGQRLRGKRVLITAAGQGIGRASVIAMSKEGAQVFATDVNMDALSTIRDANLENIEIFELDVRDSESILDGVTKAKYSALIPLLKQWYQRRVLTANTLNILPPL